MPITRSPRKKIAGVCERPRESQASIILVTKTNLFHKFLCLSGFIPVPAKIPHLLYDKLYILRSTNGKILQFAFFKFLCHCEPLDRKVKTAICNLGRHKCTTEDKFQAGIQLLELSSLRCKLGFAFAGDGVIAPFSV